MYETGTTGVKIFVYGNYIDEVLYRWPFYYYVQDHLYSPVAIYLSFGAVYERYEYDAYGEPTIWDAGFTTKKDAPSWNPYLFTGRRVDILDSGSLKIQYNRNRYYDYYTGRWLTHDPLGITPNPQKPNRFMLIDQYEDAMNLYEYAASNPARAADPWGLQAPISIGIGLPNPPYDLGKACDKYTCEQCCEVGVKSYTDKEKVKCKKEAQQLSEEYKRGIKDYWLIGRDYTKCFEYQRYIMGEDDDYPWDFAEKDRDFFSLAKGGRPSLFFGSHAYVGVFHKCNRRWDVIKGIKTGITSKIIRLGKKSDGTLDPWNIGKLTWRRGFVNKGMGNPNVQPGRTSPYGWTVDR